MGCTSQRSASEPIDQILQSQMQPLPIQNEEISQKFSQASTVLKEIEVLRRCLIDKREILFLKTGSCVRKNPSLETSLLSFFWTLANVSDGNVLSYQLYFNEGEEPHFSISNADDKYKEIAVTIAEYIKALLGFENTFNDTKSQMENIVKDFNDNYTTYKSKLTAGYTEQDAMYQEIVSVYEKNTSLIKRIERIHLLEVISEKYETDLAFIKKIGDLIGDNDYIAKINEIGKISKQKKYAPLYETCFYNISPEDRSKESPNEAKEELESKVQIKSELLANKTFG